MLAHRADAQVRPRGRLAPGRCGRCRRGRGDDGSERVLDDGVGAGGGSGRSRSGPAVRPVRHLPAALPRHRCAPHRRGRVLPRRGPQPGGDACRRGRPHRARAADPAGAAADARGADRTPLPLQHPGQRAAPVRDRPRHWRGHAGTADALPAGRVAIDARRSLDAGARRPSYQRVSPAAAGAHGAAPGVRHRHRPGAAAGRGAADDAADAGRERDQERRSAKGAGSRSPRAGGRPDSPRSGRHRPRLRR